MLFASGMSNRAQISRESLLQRYEIQLLQQTAFSAPRKVSLARKKLHEVQLNSGLSGLPQELFWLELYGRRNASLERK